VVTLQLVAASSAVVVKIGVMGALVGTLVAAWEVV
jgi:hypothetical protein